MKDPLFIAVEGLDGSGTTTHTHLLARTLRASNILVHLTQEPSSGPLGTLIRHVLSGRLALPYTDGNLNREALALLFAADRHDHVATEITPALSKGATVISDRYYHSSFAYQGDGDDQDGGEFDIGWVQTLNERVPTPDLTVYLRTPVEVCLGRIGDRNAHDVYENEEKLRHLYDRYEKVVQVLQNQDEHILTLDGTQQPTELVTQSSEAIRQMMEDTDAD